MGGDGLAAGRAGHSWHDRILVACKVFFPRARLGARSISRSGLGGGDAPDSDGCRRGFGAAPLGLQLCKILGRREDFAMPGMASPARTPFVAAHFLAPNSPAKLGCAHERLRPAPLPVPRTASITLFRAAATSQAIYQFPLIGICLFDAEGKILTMFPSTHGELHRTSAGRPLQSFPRHHSVLIRGETRCKHQRKANSCCHGFRLSTHSFASRSSDRTAARRSRNQSSGLYRLTSLPVSLRFVSCRDDFSERGCPRSTSRSKSKLPGVPASP